MPRKKPGSTTSLESTNARFALACRTLVQEGNAESLREIADALNMSPSNLNPILYGKRNVTVDIIVRFCARYFVNPAYLFPPWQKQMFLRGGREKLIRIKRIEIEQAKKELRYLEAIQ